MKLIQPIPFKVLLAEDNQHECAYLKAAITELPIATHITTVNDGEELMNYLDGNSLLLPDVLFLDLNLPLKNGFECLSEMKQDQNLKYVPVILFTTAYPLGRDYEWSMVNVLYKIGALDFISKTDDFTQFKLLIHHALIKAIRLKTYTTFGEQRKTG